MPKGNKQMGDVPKGTQAPDKRGINLQIKPSWDGRKVATMSDKAWAKAKKDAGVKNG